MSRRYECRIADPEADREIRVRATRDVGLYLARKLATDTGRTHVLGIHGLTIECSPEDDED